MTSSMIGNDNRPLSAVKTRRPASRNETIQHRNPSIEDDNDQAAGVTAEVSATTDYTKEVVNDLRKSSDDDHGATVDGISAKRVVMLTGKQSNELPIRWSQQQQQQLRRMSLSVSSNRRQTMTSSNSQTAGSWQPFFSKSSRKSMTPEMFASSARKQSMVVTANRRLRSASIAPTKYISNGHMTAPYQTLTRQEIDIERATGLLVIDLTRATLAEGDDMENADGDTDSGINRDSPNSPATKDPYSERQHQNTRSDTQSASASAISNRLPLTATDTASCEVNTSGLQDDSADATNDVIRQTLHETGSTSSDSDDACSIEDCCCSGDDGSHTVGGVFSGMSTEARQALTEFWVHVQRKRHRKCCSAVSQRQTASSTAEVNGSVEQEQQQRQTIKHRQLRTAGSVERRHFISMLSQDQKLRTGRNNISRNESNARRPESALTMRRRPTPGETAWTESVSSATSAGYRRLQRPKSETAQRRRPEVFSRPMTSQAVNRNQDRLQVSVDCADEDKFYRLTNENVERRMTSSSEAGIFRITPATYDSRYEDMAVASALDEEWGRRGTPTGVPRRWNDVNEEECIVQSVVIAKCTAWLTNLQQHKQQQRRRLMCGVHE